MSYNPDPASDLPDYLRKPLTATMLNEHNGQSAPRAVLYTTRQYPCGCAAEGSGDIPSYCPNCEPVPDYCDTTNVPAESILEEAHRITHGPRQADYGHPLDDYTCTAAIASALLSRKLKEPITPDEMALIMVGVKLSRQSRRPKRDNMVDAAGYAWVAQECRDEQERRNDDKHQNLYDNATTETK